MDHIAIRVYQRMACQGTKIEIAAPQRANRIDEFGGIAPFADTPSEPPRGKIDEISPDMLGRTFQSQGFQRRVNLLQAKKHIYLRFAATGCVKDKNIRFESYCQLEDIAVCASRAHHAYRIARHKLLLDLGASGRGTAGNQNLDIRHLVNDHVDLRALPIEKCFAKQRQRLEINPGG